MLLIGFELEEEDSVGGSIVPDLAKDFVEFVKWSTRLEKQRIFNESCSAAVWYSDERVHHQQRRRPTQT